MIQRRERAERRHVEELRRSVFGKTFGQIVCHCLRYAGITTERPNDPRGFYPDYKGIFDKKGRMMVVICHNTDLGDGWEREGEDEWYFREFSEKRAYPMGVNIIFYAMTH